MESQSSISKGNLRATLRNPNFARLLGGQVIAAFGDRINHAALLSVIIYLWGHTGKYGADIIFWGALPRPLLSLFAIGIIDRIDRKWGLVVSDLGRALVAGLIPVMMYFVPHHYGIYFMVFLIGIFTAVFVPCRLAIMPNLMESKLLMTANAVSSQAGTFAALASMPIAGWIVENLGRNSSFFINSITYLLSAVLLFGLKPEVKPADDQDHHVDAWKDYREGLQHIREHRPVLFYVTFSGLVYIFSALFVVGFLEYAVSVLHQTVGGVNLLFSVFGVGMVGGAIFLIRKSRMAERFFWPFAMMTGAGAAIAALGGILNPWMAAPFLMVAGFCSIMVQVPIDTFLQKKVPDIYRGRVFSVKGILEGTAFLISLQLSKGLLHQLGVQHLFFFMGISAFVFSIGAWWVGRRMVVE